MVVQYDNMTRYNDPFRLEFAKFPLDNCSLLDCIGKLSQE